MAYLSSPGQCSGHMAPQQGRLNTVQKMERAMDLLRKKNFLGSSIS